MNNTGTFLHLSFTFDASVTSIFLPFLEGKSLVIGSKQSVETFEDINLWKYAPYDFIKAYTFSHAFTGNVIKDGKILTRKLVVGGESLRQSHFDYLTHTGYDVEIINEYGPTEATVGCSSYSIFALTDREKHNDNMSVSIGNPMTNVEIYILDEKDNLVPIGAPGEICIGGAGLARGYLNRDDLTKQKFIKNKYNINRKGSRLYKTGDIGKWLPNGNIEYLGRNDEQVKIRGYRVELGEVENFLTSIAGISGAKVLVQQNEVVDTKKLDAYLQVDEMQISLLSNYLHLINEKLVRKSDLKILPNEATNFKP